jgi:cytoskeletal protein CcmA (bactofilin family)
MFSRHNERPPEDPRVTGMRVMPATPSTGVRDAVAVPVSPEVPPMMRHEETVVAREDRFEGTLRTRKGLRVLGQFQGHIEAATSVVIEEGASVDADLTTDEAIVAGDYSGKLVCRQRLEIRSTGLIKGEIETVRLMLHEGGFIDGELHMKRASSTKTEEPETVRTGMAPRTASIEVNRDPMRESMSATAPGTGTGMSS